MLFPVFILFHPVVMFCRFYFVKERIFVCQGFPQHLFQIIWELCEVVAKYSFKKKNTMDIKVRMESVHLCLYFNFVLL